MLIQGTPPPWLQHSLKLVCGHRTTFYHNYTRQDCNSRTEIQSELCVWRVEVGTKSLILISPIPEAIFLFDDLSMPFCHRWFSSINITSDFIGETCSIGTLSIESSSGLDKVLNFCLDSISINSVLAFKSSISKSWLKLSCIEFTSTSAYVMWEHQHLSWAVSMKYLWILQWIVNYFG